MSLPANDLWDKGIIASWYLRESQLDIYDHIVNVEDPFIECARRFGKTTSVLCYILEQLIQNPGWQVTWCEPDKFQARMVIQPEINKIQSSINKSQRFEWNVTDSFYRHPNGSKLFLRGLNHDRGDSARGSFAHIVVIDELGSIVDANSVINDVLRPLLLTTRGKLITMSTPPADLGHEYYDHKAQAIRDNRYIKKVIFDNEALTKDQIDDAMSKAGGALSPAWRREYLCEPIANPERLVIPEFKEELHTFDHRNKPSHVTQYVGIDFGFNDNTALVFGYYDFERATLVIEDEHCVKGKNSKEIIEAAKEIEAKTFNKSAKIKRVSDNDLQLIYDMLTIYDYSILPAKKDDKVAAVNLLRSRFANNQIAISNNCKNLIYQLKVGLWQNDRTFQRGVKTGHLDCIDALIYLNRSIDLGLNPFPNNVQDAQNKFIQSHYDRINKSSPVVKNIFKRG